MESTPSKKSLSFKRKLICTPGGMMYVRADDPKYDKYPDLMVTIYPENDSVKTLPKRSM